MPDQRKVSDQVRKATAFRPQEGIWSLVKRDIGERAAANLDRLLTRAVKRKLKMIQYRADLIDGCLTGTDLVS